MISEHGTSTLEGMVVFTAITINAMLTDTALRDEQVLTFDDTYLIEMTHRIAKLRELHEAMADTGKPRRWIDTLNLDTLR